MIRNRKSAARSAKSKGGASLDIRCDYRFFEIRKQRLKEQFGLTDPEAARYFPVRVRRHAQ